MYNIIQEDVLSDEKYEGFSLGKFKKLFLAGQQIEDFYTNNQNFSFSEIEIVDIGYKNKDFNVEEFKVETFLRIGRPRVASFEFRYVNSYNFSEDMLEKGVSVLSSKWFDSSKSIFFGISDEKLSGKGIYEIQGIKLPETGGDDEPVIYPVNWAKKTDIMTLSELIKNVKELEEKQSAN